MSSPESRLMLRLFVSGRSVASLHAFSAVEQLQRQGIVDEVEVIDVLERPGVAEAERILLTPTLVRVAPGPQRRVVGDLSDPARVLVGLGFDSPPGAA